MHRVGHWIEPLLDQDTVLLRCSHGALAGCGLTVVHGRGKLDSVGNAVGLDLLPLVLGVLRCTTLRLLIPLGVPPTLLGLVGVVIGKAVAEQLFLLFLGQLDT